jgi:hypothetical protein
MKFFSKYPRRGSRAKFSILAQVFISLVGSSALLSAQLTGQTATAASPDGVHMETIQVTTKIDQNTLMEDQLVGDNQQPAWTSQRRFPTTRIYVLPPWQFEVEQWWNGKFNRGDPTVSSLIYTKITTATTI